MSEGQPRGASVPGDLRLGCLWHLLIIGALLVVTWLESTMRRGRPSDVPLYLYVLGVVALVARQFRRGRPYVALGILLLPVTVVLVSLAYVAVYGLPGG